MAVTYNAYDKLWYGTNAERTAVTLPDDKFSATAKFYEYDTGNVYITNGSTWYLM